MRDASPQTVYLKDYQPFGWEVEDVHLTFDLAPHATRVRSRIRFAPKPGTAGPLFLHGEHLTLIRASIDGKAAHPDVTAEGLSVAVPDTPFTWEAEVEIDPANNTALEGLYVSNGMYCTQCEAEGFRRITYYPDRPDVMSTFTVRINSDLPVLLSNGNPVTSGDGYAEWHDPWPKPAYLFALVAGDLRATSGQFTTMSGKEVELNVWVRPGDEGKTDFALEALKKSMKWDEDVYGREYDLDVFNIVAVDDFNMGAMENKGLNIFNSAAVLASPETATDANYERIESIIAHEYFHNWTGNRITCRDWFQLCLKEGLTVFRDQQFSAETGSAAVKRIEDVLALRARQFREDTGPLAHPVRPESFVEINNFYTATVYEKGAEVIGMLKRLVGDDGWARGVALYFDRHDGQACTVEDWLAAFEDATGRDLSQFKLWYSQAGTPRLDVAEAFDWKERTGSYLGPSFLIDFLTPDEYWHFVGQTYDLDETTINERLSQFDDFYVDEPIGETTKYLRDLSTGNKNKVGLVAAMLPDPDFLVFDEPFASLDPRSQIQLKELLQARHGGATMLVSSHDLGHVTDVSDRIAILEDGEIVRDEPTDPDTLEDLTTYFAETIRPKERG